MNRKKVMAKKLYFYPFLGGVGSREKFSRGRLRGPKNFFCAKKSVMSVSTVIKYTVVFCCTIKTYRGKTLGGGVKKTPRQ